MRQRFFSIAMLLCIMMSLCVPAFAKGSVDKMTDENTYITDDGKVYTYQEDKVYQLIDGKLYEVVNGNEQSIIDVFKAKPGSERPDGEVMSQVQDGIGKTVGLALSVIIYVFFAMTAFTTVCDLAYIGVPPIRSLLYENAGGSANANIHTSVMHGIAQSQMNRAGQAAMQGDMARAASLQGQAMRSEAEGQYRDQNWFGNRDAMARAQAKASGGSGGRCFISSDLKSLVNAGQVNVTMTSGSAGYGQGPVQVGTTNSNIMLKYFKRRAVSIVVIVVVFMLLVTSTVFTDFGLDIGSMIYRQAAKFLGF